MSPARRAVALYVTVLLIATSGLVYELVAGAVASYVLGDSVAQFSLVIGVYLSALGLGAYLSRVVERDLAVRFVEIELATAILGGVSAPLQLYAFAHAGAFQPVLWATVLVTGTLVGLELPLLMRLLTGQVELKELLAKALLFDYLGALVASVLFALVLVPTLGLVRTSLAAGLVNVAVALASTFLLADEVAPARARLRASGLVVLAILGGLFARADWLTRQAEVALYPEPILDARQSSYQRIVITGERDQFSLWLNANLQFSSVDERRYHEALVHPAFATTAPGAIRSVLVLGGGDGLAVRELRRYPEIERVTLVDLDPAMTALAREHPLVAALNERALFDPRVTVENADAMTWLQANRERADLLVVDFPDPNNLALGKLYTTRFYRAARAHLNPGGRIVVQATSPYFSRESFWTIVATMEAAGLSVAPYHALVPSFGEWGFALGAEAPFAPPTALRATGLRTLDDATLARLFVFPRDMERTAEPVNRLDTQHLVRLYEKEIGRLSAN